VTATTCGAGAIYLLDETMAGALTWIWLITAFWIIIRALFGVIRIWPGPGNSPLKSKHSDPNFIIKKVDFELCLIYTNLLSYKTTNHQSTLSIQYAFAVGYEF